MDSNPALNLALEAAPRHRDRLTELREILLANLVMIGETPSPTFGEERLVRFLCDRFTEEGLQNISTDQADNAIAILPGTQANRNLLICAHADRIWSPHTDHTITVNEDHLVGPGVGDNSLGLATVATLPIALDRLGISLNSNLILMGDTRSMGRGDLGGLRFFLENTHLPVHSAIVLEGMELGRLNFTSLGMIQAEIRLAIQDDDDANVWGAEGAIVALNKAITRILAIERPEQPRTSIVLGSVDAGSDYGVAPDTAILRLEVKSEQPGMVSRIRSQIEEIVEEVNAQHKVQAQFEVIARRRPGELPFSHPLPPRRAQNPQRPRHRPPRRPLRWRPFRPPRPQHPRPHPRHLPRPKQTPRRRDHLHPPHLHRPRPSDRPHPSPRRRPPR